MTTKCNIDTYDVTELQNDRSCSRYFESDVNIYKNFGGVKNVLHILIFVKLHYDI